MSIVIDLLDEIAKLLHLSNDAILISHNRQLDIKQTAKLIAELLTIVLNLEFFFVIGDIVENDLDLSELFLNLLIEIFTLRAFLGKLRFGLCVLLCQCISLLSLLLVFRYLYRPSCLFRFKQFGKMFQELGEVSI